MTLEEALAIVASLEYYMDGTIRGYPDEMDYDEALEIIENFFSNYYRNTKL